LDLIMDLNLIFDNVDLMWRGLKLTLQLSAVIIVAGSLLGMLVGVGLLYGNRVVRTLLRIYVDVIRGAPLLVVMFLIFYGLPALNITIAGRHVNTNIGRFPTAAIAFSIFSAAHVGEIVRGAINAIPKGQTDAAKSIGLTFWPRLFHVLVPQALPVILPPWTNTAAELVKGTSLVTLVSMSDLLYETQKVSARTGGFLELYAFAAVVYFVICFTISRSGALAVRRFRYGVAN
jgi:polar amino acid transport system permease protein